MQRASEKAYDYIKEKILNGSFHPAQRLVETQLASEIAVSRNSVRKALQQLEKDRLIAIEANKGAKVISLDINHILQYYEIRIALECIIVRAAAANITEAQLAQLAETYDIMKDLCEKQDYVNYSKNNIAFHNLIYTASRKPVIAAMISEIKMQLSRYQIKTMLVPGRAKESLVEHRALLDALRARDAERAVESITIHLSNVSDTLEKYIKIFY